MKILLFGKNGQVGWELQRSLAPLGEVIAPDLDSSQACGNLANLTGIASTIRSLSPDLIVNAAAYTAVDKAQTEREAAFCVNAEAPGVMALEAKRLDAWLVHYSTDYVFDGQGRTPWQESDAVAPLNLYGASKFAGDQAIANSGCRHLIFRTSWVYAARGNNFAKTMLRLARERDSLNVIDDQYGAPTGGELLADVTAHALRMAQHSPGLSGLYHLTAAGETNWCEYARFVLAHAQGKGLDLKVAPQDISPISSSGYPSVAQRPQNSRLNTQKLERTFRLSLPSWQSGVERMLTEVLEKSA
ncbi:MAG: dTDP-4-dehydrorhamnose reductase [Gammaproteobacteria bacterium]|jgi:dTDP-4-dehydrorhamnose reductase